MCKCKLKTRYSFTVVMVLSIAWIYSLFVPFTTSTEHFDKDSFDEIEHFNTLEMFDEQLKMDKDRPLSTIKNTVKEETFYALKNKKEILNFQTYDSKRMKTFNSRTLQSRIYTKADTILSESEDSKKFVDSKPSNSLPSAEIFIGKLQHYHSKVEKVLTEQVRRQSRYVTFRRVSTRNAFHVNMRNETEVDLFGRLGMSEDEKNTYLYENNVNSQLKPHMRPKDVKSKMKDILPWWELQEVEMYPKVWFVGEKANKTILNRSDPLNYGFDWETKHEEFELKIVNGDHLEYRYEILEKLGSGSFGSVVEALDHAVPITDPNHLVAIKIMHNDSSVTTFFKQELDMMKLIQQTTNSSQHFSTVLRTFFFRNHLCIVMELLGPTLGDVHQRPLTDLKLLGKYAEDMMKGLKLLHDQRIIHGDLKPKNLMLSRHCNSSCPIFLKIADFTSTCIQNSTEYSCDSRSFHTRYYRAPEVLLGYHFDVKADVWSVGVILTELFRDRAPFRGETSADQLAAIMEVMGIMPPVMVKEAPWIDVFQDAICYRKKNGRKRVPYKTSLEEVLRDAPPLFFDFIEKCLALHPDDRMTSSEALLHPFIANKE